MNADCIHALDLLKRALEIDTDFDPEILAHLKSCSACRANLGAALKKLEVADAPASAVDPVGAESEVRKGFRRRLLQRSIVIGAILAATCFGLLAYQGHIQDGTILLALFLLGIIPSILLTFWLVRTPARVGLYKRLCPGRQISGVCMGLAQHSRTSIWIWRLGFVLIFLLPRFGTFAALWLYVFLDLVMPVHPDDRSGLLRFRLARWWRGLRTKTA